MKRFNVLLTLAIAFTMVAFAQNAPVGKMLPFNNMAKRTTAKALSFQTPHRDAPPETATVETDWVLEGNYINNQNPYTNTNTISVAFDGNQVYIQGLVFLCPDAWIVGTIGETGETVTFANGQYAGVYYETPIYACGSTDGENMDDILFNYDADAKRLELANYYIENTDVTSFSFYFFSYDIVLYKNIEQPAPTDVTVDPTATTATVAWTENGDAIGWNLRYRYMPEVQNLLWDFEDTDQLEGWMALDNDGDGFNWLWADARYATHSGNGVMISASYDNDSTRALTPDNWLISPEIPMGGQASFWYAGQDTTYCSEVFGVYLYVGDNLTNLSDFVQIGEDVTATGKFQQFTIDLSEYEGVGRIAIRHYNVTDMFFLNIDDFAVEVPGGEYPGEWEEINEISENPYTIEGLTPETNYQVEVQAVGAAVSDWTAPVDFTTLPEAPAIPNVYILGEVGEQTWAPNAGYKMDYNAEDNLYTATVTFDGRGESGENYFSFTTELAENNDDGGWAYIEPYRYGAVSEGDFWYDDMYDGQPLDITPGKNAFRIMGGEYKITVDLNGLKVIIERVGAQVMPGDVNNDGIININDVTTLIDHQLNSDFEDAEDFSRANADVDGDGEINVGDLAALIDMLLN